MKIRAWIEAMRLRTLPVSVAGVVGALGYARLLAHPDMLIFVLCLLFALLAQIASNFANEYFDYKAGVDRPGRYGPRRGVTEGDISPRAMRNAAFGRLCDACIIGLLFVVRGGWPIFICGVIIVLGALAYSAGPFPLSRRCLGEVAVIVFFGLAPVCLTFYLMTGYIDNYVWAGGLAIGLMGANVLLVNNIRDISDDRASGKHTLVTVFGRRFGSFLYLFNGWMAVYLTGSVWLWIGGAWLVVPAVWLVAHTVLWYYVDSLSRKAAQEADTATRLNPCLGLTATLMALYSIAFAIAA